MGLEGLDLATPTLDATELKCRTPNTPSLTRLKADYSKHERLFKPINVFAKLRCLPTLPYRQFNKC